MTARRIAVASGMVLILAVGLGAARGGGGTDCPNTGPDVVVSDIYDTQTWGTLDGEIAFTIGTNACNIGDEVLNWIGDTADHPVIAQSLYRIKNGRMEQIGVAWLKHGYGALQDPGCGCTCVPADYQHLGVGCSDAYNASINGIQTGLGPRLDVNPHTGVFSFPPSVWGESGSIVEKRLRIDLAKVEAASKGGSTYLVEAQYVSAADSTAENQANNVSWRSCEFVASGGTWQMALTGETQVAASAVEAWSELDPDVLASRIDVPGDGQIVVGTRADEISEGWYRYTILVQNVTSARAVGGVSLDISEAGLVSASTFHGVKSYGELIDSTDWAFAQAADSMSWSTEPYEENPTANAIRWGTTYTYSFETNVPPVDGSVSIELFEPGKGAVVSVPGIVPSSESFDPCDLSPGPCPWELDGSAGIGGGDLTVLLGSWGTCGDGTFRPTADLNGDCCVDGADLTELLGAWGIDCTVVGSCCFDDGTCFDDLTEAACVRARGSYQGDGITCSDASCPQPGACCYSDGSCEEGLFAYDCTVGGGVFSTSATCAEVSCVIGSDDCVSAPPIVDGVHVYSTVSATSDGPIHPECETGGDGGVVGHDIWFTYEPIEDGMLQLSTCNTADYDTEILLYQGVECALADLVACNDDAPGCSGFSSELFALVQADQSYLIRLGGWREGSYGTGRVLIELIPEALFADDCADAIPIEDGLHEFSTLGATTDGPVHPECKISDKGVTGNDIWFLYTAVSSGILEVSTCNLVNYDSDLIVYDGADCDALVLLGCNDDAPDCAGYSSHVEVSVVEGGVYLIRVGGWHEGSVGSGQLSIHLESP